jgi:hypothetical protein
LADVIVSALFLPFFSALLTKIVLFDKKEQAGGKSRLPGVALEITVTAG